MRVLLDRRAPVSLRRLIDDTAPPWMTVVDCGRDEPRFGDEFARAEVVLHVLDPITAHDLEAASALRLIQKLGTGVNTIDLNAAAVREVAVTNMPGANAPAVAELTVGLLLAGLREIAALDRGTRAGTTWPGGPDEARPGRELGGLLVGLVGYGEIARRVERAVRAFGARTIHHRRTRDHDGWTGLDDLVRTADVVSLHVPLTAETTHLIDRPRLDAMREGAVLVNTARGGLVDHDALADALESGHLGAACLDVLPEEPLAPDHRLFTAPRLVVSPHVGWYTDETLARCWERALDNCRRLRDGEPLRDRVR